MKGHRDIPGVVGVAPARVGKRDGLRIALDARPLTTSRAGIATYCCGLVYGLAAVVEDEVVCLYAKEPPPSDLHLPLGPALRWRAVPAQLWLPVAVPRALHAGHIDVFHGTNYMAPPLTATPTVITVHDLTTLTLPRHHTWRNRLLTVPQMLLSLRLAARLIAVSASTARDLAGLPGINPARIRVIPEAPAPGLTPATPAAVEELIQRLDLPRDFFLYLGALEPRKNVVTLVRAVGQLRAAGVARITLVIAGAEGWRNDDVWREVQRRGLEGIVRFSGYVSPQDLPALYGAALAFVYPSFFEGFGLPPLEAMACGTPVVCSNTSSLPEVVGDAALTIDPYSVDDLAAAMHRLLGDEELRSTLRAAGPARAGMFSWQRTARETLAVYHEAAAARHGTRS